MRKLLRYLKLLLCVVHQPKNLQVVFPDFGGPSIAILIGTTGLGEDCFMYFKGCMMNSSLARGEQMK